MINDPEVHDLLYFKVERPELYEYATKYLMANERFMAILAPVKSGKRLMVEITALLTRATPKKFRKCEHFYVTALQRKDTKTQIAEMESYRIIPLIVASMDGINSQVAKIREKVNAGITCYVHIDESDYGTGKKQCLGKFYKRVEKLGDLVRFRYYSATNEELIYCKDFTKKFPKPEPFFPPKAYRGAEWFLSKNLIHEAYAFYDNNGLTQHGRELCKSWKRDSKASGKIISVLRDIGGSQDKLKLKYNTKVQQELKSLGIACKFIDKNNEYEWDTSTPEIKLDTLTLLVIDRTCTRSTEVGFHKHIYFWHDFRSEASCYNSMAQAFLRVAHYDKKGHTIKVYAMPEVFELAAGRITAELYDRKLSARIGKTKEIVDTYSVIALPATKENLVKLEKLAKKTIVLNNDTHRTKDRYTRNILQNFGDSFSQTLKTMELIKTQNPTFSEKMIFTGSIVDDNYYPIRNFSTWQFSYNRPITSTSKVRNQAKMIEKSYPYLKNKLVFIRKHNHQIRTTKHLTKSTSMLD